MIARTLFLLLWWCAAVPGIAQTAAPDHAREKRWADEITPAILVGDAVHIAQKSGHKFLSIYTPNARARAGVIVVHGMGVHPDWNLINVLRSELAEQGYATLSVQMPVLAADAKGELYPALFPDAAERLQAAADFLRDRLSLGKLHGLPAALLSKIAYGMGRGTDRLVMRGLECAIVDEADSVLIDEAVTPLIISGDSPNAEQTVSYEQAAALAKQLKKGEDYKVDLRFREVTMTNAGKQKASDMSLEWGGIWGNSWILDPTGRTSVVAFTNTMREGCNGPFRDQIRDAVFG